MEERVNVKQTQAEEGYVNVIFFNPFPTGPPPPPYDQQIDVKTRRQTAKLPTWKQQQKQQQQNKNNNSKNYKKITIKKKLTCSSSLVACTLSEPGPGRVSCSWWSWWPRYSPPGCRRPSPPDRRNPSRLESQFHTWNMLGYVSNWSC